MELLTQRAGRGEAQTFTASSAEHGLGRGGSLPYSNIWPSQQGRRT